MAEMQVMLVPQHHAMQAWAGAVTLAVALLLLGVLCKPEHQAPAAAVENDRRSGYV